MFKMDAYELNGVEYIVADFNDDMLSQSSLEFLADRECGIGADRVVVVDKITGKLIKVVSALYGLCTPTVGDYAVCEAYLYGTSGYEPRHSELRLTDYFFQQVVTAGSVGVSAAC